MKLLSKRTEGKIVKLFSSVLLSDNRIIISLSFFASLKNVGIKLSSIVDLPSAFNRWWRISWIGLIEFERTGGNFLRAIPFPLIATNGCFGFNLENLWTVTPRFRTEEKPSKVLRDLEISEICWKSYLRFWPTETQINFYLMDRKTVKVLKNPQYNLLVRPRYLPRIDSSLWNLFQVYNF